MLAWHWHKDLFRVNLRQIGQNIQIELKYLGFSFIKGRSEAYFTE